MLRLAPSILIFMENGGARGKPEHGEGGSF